MTGFVQVIEYTTSRQDDIDAFMRDWRQRHPVMGPARATVTVERGAPHKHLAILEFASYEDAVRNDEDPATQEFAAFMRSACDGPPVYHDLDVLRTEIRTDAPGVRAGSR